MLLDCGRQPEYLEKSHTWAEPANPMQKDPRSGFEPRIFLLESNSANNCVTLQTQSQPANNKTDLG